MKTFYQITSKETGVIMLRRRKIAKAFRWWLRENGVYCKSTHCIKYGNKLTGTDKLISDKKLQGITYHNPDETEIFNDEDLPRLINSYL